MAGEVERTEDRPQISPIDRSGRPIDPAVLLVTERLAPRVLPYAEEVLGDSAVAVSLLEECAAAVSRVLRSGRNLREQPIKNIRAYLFRTFIRRVCRLRRKEVRLSALYRVQSQANANAAQQIETKLLVQEIIARFNPAVQDMFHRRSRGFSWREIGKIHGISAHTAEARFSAALKRLKRKLG